MKRLTIGATILALLTSPVAIAQPDGGRGRSHAENRQHEGRQWSSHNANRRDSGRHRGWGRDRGNYARWGRGQQMGYNDWHNSRPVNYRRHNLRQPPRGYEWRRNDDRYILAAVASGLIISVIMANGR